MQVKSLNDRPYRLRLVDYPRRVGRTAEAAKSKWQSQMGQVLAAEFPSDRICEEVRVPGERFILDFLVPGVGLVVECHGRQHTEFVPHFHGNHRVFNDQKARDSRVRQWCKLNNLTLLELPAGTTEEEARRRIRGAFGDHTG